MNKSRFYISTLGITLYWLLLSPSLWAQNELTIQGKVINQNGEPLDAVTLFLFPMDSDEVVTYVLTNANGLFQLTSPKALPGDSLRIKAMRMGISTEQFILPNRSQQEVELKLKEQSFDLSTIEIKAKKIDQEGDTLKYFINSFQSVTDKSLADVLKKMPGITVQKSGQVLYQGEAISGFYIEGLDMLGGSYGVATNNIHPDDVASVEVLQNHQKIEALQELSISDKAAINIRLKESSKGVWAMLAELAMGLEEPNKLLGNGKLMGSRFSRKSQILTLLKANNTGNNLGRELTSFDSRARSLPSPVASIGVGVPPLLDEENYRKNNDLSATTNLLFTVGEKRTIGGNLVLLHEEEHPAMSRKTRHLLPNGEEVLFDEHEKGKMIRNSWSGNIFLNTNKPNYYLDSRIGFDVAQRECEALIYAEEDFRASQKEVPYNLRYDLEWIKAVGQAKMTLTSQNSMTTHPQTLYLQDIQQKIKEKQAESHTKLSFWKRSSLIPRLKLTASLFYNWDYSSLFLSEHQVRYPTHEAGAILSAYFSHKMLSLWSDLKLAYVDKSLQSDEYRSQLKYANFTPQVGFKLVPLRNFTINGDYSYSRQAPHIHSLYTFPILLGHRTSSQYEGELFLSSWHRVGLSMSYKHVPKMFFTSLHATYFHTQPNRLYGSTIEKQRIKMKTVMTDRTGQRYSIVGRLSKAFYWKSLKIGAEMGRYQTEMPILLQDEVLLSNIAQWRGAGDFYMKPFSFLEINLTSEFNSFKNRLENGKSRPAIQQWNNQLHLNFKPIEGLIAGVHFMHYYNGSNQNKAHFNLCNLSIGYDWSKVSLYGKVTNLFNTDSYIYSRINNSIQMDASYPLRARAYQIGINFKIL